MCKNIQETVRTVRPSIELLSSPGADLSQICSPSLPLDSPLNSEQAWLFRTIYFAFPAHPAHLKVSHGIRSAHTLYKSRETDSTVPTGCVGSQTCPTAGFKPDFGAGLNSEQAWLFRTIYFAFPAHPAHLKLSQTNTASARQTQTVPTVRPSIELSRRRFRPDLFAVITIG
jgi:hypothetical protein